MWQAKAVEVVFSLTPISEFIEKTGANQIPVYEKLGFEVIEFGTEDCSTWDIEILERLVDSIQTRLTEGCKLVVHCSAGRDRTGTVIASFLAKLNGWEAITASSYTSEKYSIAPQSEVQRASLRKFVERNIDLGTNTEPQD